MSSQYINFNEEESEQFTIGPTEEICIPITRRVVTVQPVQRPQRATPTTLGAVTVTRDERVPLVYTKSDVDSRLELVQAQFEFVESEINRLEVLSGTDNNLEIPVAVSKGGTGAITRSSALFNLGIDINNKQEGAILAYKSNTGNFEATNQPINLSINGGFF